MSSEPILEKTADGFLDTTLRPSLWDEYVGQGAIKENLKILLRAAKERGQPPEHLLFYGPPGLGKTTLSYLIAKEIEEVLYPAMEQGSLDIILGKGPSARTIQLELPPFTLIASTTRIALLSSPLRSRFSGGVFRLEFYTKDEIKKIIRRSAKILSVTMDDGACDEIAERSRFTPRTANYLLKRCRDFAQIAKGPLVREKALEAFALLQVDSLGLSPADRKILEIIVKNFHGGPVGVNTIATAPAPHKEEATVEGV